MAVLIKFLALIYCIILFFHFAENNNVSCAVVSLLLLIILSFDLGKRIKRVKDGMYSKLKKYPSYRTYQFPNNNKPQSASKNTDFFWDNSCYGNNDDTDDVLKKRKLSTNFIEFCGEKTFLVKREQTTPPNKVMVKSTNTKFIMIPNSIEIGSIRKKIYDIIIDKIDNPSLLPNERYALLQSIINVEVKSNAIIIYVDEYILNKGKISLEKLHKGEIIKAICDDETLPNSSISFVKVNNVNVLNYFLKKNER